MRPRLHIFENDLKSLRKAFPGAVDELKKRFLVVESSRIPTSIKGWGARPLSIAKALKSVVLSSDADCPYYACALQGPSPVTKAFFTGTGIKPKDSVKIGGVKQPRLSIAKGKSSVQFLTALSDDEFADIDEYVEKADQKAHAKAGALLEKVSSPVQVTLCCEDGVSKVVLTVASDRGPKDSVLSWYEGVLSVRIDS